MQAVAIRAVKRFSSVSGLLLNVKKSAAIAQGTHTGSNAEHSFGTKKENSDDGAESEEAVLFTLSTRYLGHFAGSEDTTEEVWRRALKALSVCLALVMTKTNTAQQRGSNIGSNSSVKALIRSQTRLAHGGVDQRSRLENKEFGMKRILCSAR